MTCLPLYHVNAQTMAVLSAMTVRGTCILLESFSASKYWSQLRRHRASFTSLVAMQVRTILAQTPSASDRDHQLRRFSFFINVTESEKIAFERRFGVEFLNGYGLTEAMGVVSFSPIYGPQRWPSVGLPAGDRSVQIVDGSGTPLPQGEIGEIAVRGTPGRTIMRGYFDDPAATAEAVKRDWLFTGDQGYLDEAGYLYFSDRDVNLIKRSGENISASEIEEVLMEHDAVAEVAVVGAPDPIRDEVVRAYVVLADESQGSIEDLADHCRVFLAPFKIPEQWVLVDALPRTAIKGDIDKKVIRGWLHLEEDENV